MPVGRDWLLRHLPHQGAMNLLDRVESWDAASIHAIATRHRDAGHPLRREGALPAVHGIEYGAQAAAAHGALSGAAPSRPGFIASVRSVVMHAPRLDDVESPLDVRAEQLGGDASGVLYGFEIRAAGRLLVEGRVAVAFP